MPAATDDLSSVDLQQLQSAANWQAQFRLLTQWGSLITHKPEIRSPQTKVRGCETDAWLTHTQVGDLYFFIFDSDSKIIRGLAAIALSITCGKTRGEIQQLDLNHLLQQLGIRKHLTPSRSNGFRTILNRIEALVGLPPGA